MSTKLFAAAAIALATLSGSALAGPNFAYDSRDLEIQALQNRADAARTAEVFVTPINPTLDPAYDARDAEIAKLQANAAGATTGSVIATNDSGLTLDAPAAYDPAYDARDAEIEKLQKRAFGG